MVDIGDAAVGPEPLVAKPLTVELIRGSSQNLEGDDLSLYKTPGRLSQEVISLAAGEPQC